MKLFSLSRLLQVLLKLALSLMLKT